MATAPNHLRTVLLLGAVLGMIAYSNSVSAGGSPCITVQDEEGNRSCVSESVYNSNPNLTQVVDIGGIPEIPPITDLPDVSVPWVNLPIGPITGPSVDLTDPRCAAFGAGYTYSGTMACGTTASGGTHAATTDICSPPNPSSTSAAAQTTTCSCGAGFTMTASGGCMPPSLDNGDEGPGTPDPLVDLPTFEVEEPPPANNPRPAPDWQWDGFGWTPPGYAGEVSACPTGYSLNGGGTSCGAGGPTVTPPPAPVVPPPTPVTPPALPDLTASEVSHAASVQSGVVIPLTALIRNIGTVPTDQ